MARWAKKNSRVEFAMVKCVATITLLLNEIEQKA